MFACGTAVVDVFSTDDWLGPLLSGLVRLPLRIILRVSMILKMIALSLDPKKRGKKGKDSREFIVTLSCERDGRNYPRPASAVRPARCILRVTTPTDPQQRPLMVPRGG